MIRYDRKNKALHAFKAVRVLSAKDMYMRYGQRVPVDKSNFIGFSRNPLERMENAMEHAHISAEEHYRLMNELEKQNQASQQNHQSEEKPEPGSE